MAEFDTNGPTIVSVTWLLFIVCSSFLATRIYAKFSRGQGLWWDDWVLIFSWAMFFAETIMTQFGYLLGYGKHYHDIPPENLSLLALGTSIGASVSCFANTGSKMSFGVTLLRLTCDRERRFVWFAIISLFVIMLPSAIFTWVQCTPTEKAWNTLIDGYCWDKSITINYGYFNAAYCAVMDFALALVGIKLIASLHMETKEKIGVSIAMGMGILAGLCAIIKGYYLGQLRSRDFYYNGINVTLWTATETATAIIGASIPVLRVFFKEKLAFKCRSVSSWGVSLPTVRTRGVRTPQDSNIVPISMKRAFPGWTPSIIAREDEERDKSVPGGQRSRANSDNLLSSEFMIDFPASTHGWPL